MRSVARACIETHRYCLRVSIPSQSKPVSTVSSIWYQYRPIPTLSPICSQCCYLFFFPAIPLNSTYFAHWLCLFFPIICSVFHQIFSNLLLPGKFWGPCSFQSVQNRNYTSRTTTTATATRATRGTWTGLEWNPKICFCSQLKSNHFWVWLTSAALITCIRAEELVMQAILHCHWVVGSWPTINSDSGKEGIDCSKSSLILSLLG